jgi:hypothetical protein
MKSEPRANSLIPANAMTDGRAHEAVGRMVDCSTLLASRSPVPAFGTTREIWSGS